MFKTAIKKILLSEISETEGNPNVMDKETFRGLVESMKKKGWYFEPCTIWEYEKGKYRAISGHKRIQAGIEAGIKEIKCNVIDDPSYTEKQARLDLMEANHRKGKDDEELAKRFLENIIGDFDIGIDKIVDEIGISDAEIEEILNFADSAEDNEQDDEVPEVETTNIKLGDMFQLGEHRVMCGNSTKREDVGRLMGGDKADMVFTDPPYGVAIGDKNKLLNSMQKKSRSIKENIAFDTLHPEELRILLLGAFRNIKAFSNDCCSYYVTSPQGGELGMMMMMMMADAGLQIRHVLIWVKNRQCFSLGRLDYEYKHEPILYTWNKKHKFYGNGNHRTSVWEIAKEAKCNLHPTMKPVELIINAILNSTRRNMIIADIFLGSGSTLIACEKTNRKCCGMEIDPVYVQATINRWENFSGEIAKKI